MPKKSFIQSYSYKVFQQRAEDYKKEKSAEHLRCSDFRPGEEGFHRAESGRTLFRKWQVNPKPGEECWTIGQYFNVEKILCDVKFRTFFQGYRSFNTFLNRAHAERVRDEALEFLERKQYELYGITKQLDLFDDRIQLVDVIKNI